MSDTQIITSSFLSIELRKTYLDAEAANALFTKLYTRAPWPHSHTTKSGALSKRRNKVIFGDDALVRIGYKATFRGKECVAPVRPWSSAPPELKELRDRIAADSKQDYHVCVLQLYNNGEVGINPHRDKEMSPKTIIASVSLGSTRIMRFERNGCPTQNIALPAGSLCLLHPPTNDMWVHSIPADTSITQPRISAIFRNCATMI